MSYLSGYQKGNKLPKLRERILKIAASYVKQTNYSGLVKNYKTGVMEQNTRYGFNDINFEKKIQGVGWSRGQHWCNYFIRLVYKEALTEGNNYIPSTTSYPNTWENVGDGKGSYLLPPVNTKGGTIVENWKNKYDNWKKSAQTSYVESTRQAYQNTNNYIPINNNPTFINGLGAAKNNGQASKAKAAITNGYVLPGDYVTFDWDRAETGDNGKRFNQHIGIYIAPATPDCSRILVLDGNWSLSVSPPRSAPIISINGFGQLITRTTV